ncbi:MAG: glycoside hydrolase family 38 C-terminal domain-containing protein, partial [Acidimicrobiales bacterium]
MHIKSISSTYCFVHKGEHLAQVVRVVLAGAPVGTQAKVSITGPGIDFEGSWEGRLDPALAGLAGGPAWAPARDVGLRRPARFVAGTDPPEGVVVELPVIFAQGKRPGTTVPAQVVVEASGWARAAKGRALARARGELVVRAPGWSMVMVPHFHYDPVWWNTQAGYTSSWDDLLWAQDRREAFQHSGLALVEAHLERARSDPRYKFVLAEVDYLKPFWDLCPERREEVRALIADGRLEVVGMTYNEPSTNLIGAETTIRDVVHGLGFQRDVMGAAPESAWQLDVFGHDPNFPGIMAACGATSSAWARGPFHQWGPHKETGRTSWAQFPSEFEWVAPNGLGLLTSYMPLHYSAGWELERASTLEGAMWLAYEIFCNLAENSATKVTLLPVGTDFSPPSRFATDLAELWSARYAWPRFSVGLPKEFFAALRAELGREGRQASPQSRDMNPIYTGKDVSFVDTKQAQRQVEVALAEAEAMAALTVLLGGSPAWRSLDKAWRQLVFNAHHDGITGSGSDQVYLDLLGGWREAYELARRAESAGRAELVAAIGTRGDGQAIVVTNTLAGDRTEVVSAEVPAPLPGEAFDVVDGLGAVLSSAAGPGQRLGTRAVSFLAASVPGVGYKTFWLRKRPGAAPGWAEVPGVVISNDHLEVEASPAKGGGLARVSERDSGFELVPPGEVANCLVVYPEYPEHPRFGEGPWNLVPSGPPSRSTSAQASVRRQRCALGERLVIEGAMPSEGFAYRQVATLWQGSRRLELRTEVHGWASHDRLLRLSFPTRLVGATPVSAVGGAVIARGFGIIDVDSAEAPWTLDNPVAEWGGLSTTLVVEACEAGGPVYHTRSVGVAEVVTPSGQGAAPWARQLVVALVQKGVTATCSEAEANRYGALLGDSNLPDFRIAVGRPEENAFVAEVLAAAGPAYRRELSTQLASRGRALLLVPAERPLREVWVPNADLRAARALPVLIVAGRPGSQEAALSALVGDVASGRVRVDQPRPLVPRAEKVPDWTVALLNRGTLGFAVDTAGTLYASVLRACSGWPSGVWVDPPRRKAPDGSALQLEHWSHVFEHALVLGRGDWRQTSIPEEAQAYNRPLLASVAEPKAGRLPPTCRLLGLRSVGATTARAPVLLAALKPAGNPLASSDAATWPAAGPDGAQVTLRAYEMSGNPAEVEVTSWFPLSGARRANPLEEPGEELAVVAVPAEGEAPSGDQAVRLCVGPGELCTVRLQFGPSQFEASPGAPSRGSFGAAQSDQPHDVEVAQPVFSRYWLHNKGAAPMGNQGLAVHVLTTSVVARSGHDVQLVTQVTSSSARAPQAGRVKVVAPSGWLVDPEGQDFFLAPGAFLRKPVRVAVPEGCRPGRYFLAARAADDAGQFQEDVTTVDVGPDLPEATTAARAKLGADMISGALTSMTGPVPFRYPGGQVPAELEASVDSLAVEVPPGPKATLALRLANRTSSEIRGGAQLLCPVEAWPLVQPWEQGFVIAPGDELRV